MDVERAIEVLEWWVDTAKRASGGYDGALSPQSPGFKALQAREDQTRRVLAAVQGSSVLPDLLVGALYEDEYYVGSGIREAEYALGKLRTDSETRAILGSQAPTMKADALHPIIWQAASKHWEVGHFSAAVQRAATMLNADIQDRVGRHDVSDTVLMQQTFSDKAPESDKPRLRWPGADSDLTVKAMRQGILNLSQGVFLAIRNPVTHSTEDMERQEALEQLATLSILARWIDRCELVSV